MAPHHDARAALVATLFPNGVPRLICPLLTHYRDDGALDAERIRAHIAHMRPHVSAFLAPGSTGDGWEMGEDETTELLDLLVNEASRQDFALMAGVLRTAPGTVVPAITALLDRYVQGSTDPARLAARHLCGFTVTAPKGANLDQAEIRAELDAIAATGAPIAVYQLPQITDNEMAPQTVADLVARWPNVYLMKDTSGADHVVGAHPDLANLYLVRGAEGDYAGWLKDAGGPYDGLLLSTANSFAPELGAMIEALERGDRATADDISARVTAAVTALFAEAASLPFGNPFANANKAFDHHFAWGPRALDQPGPMTHSGARLPASLIERAGELLRYSGFTAGAGYLA